MSRVTFSGPSRPAHFGGTTDYAQFGADGTLKLYGAATVWEDLPVNVTSGKIPGSSAPSWTTWDFGIGSGVAFQVLGFGVDEYLDFVIQSPHKMKLSTALKNHLHFGVPSNDTGKKFKFKLDVVAAGVDEQFAVPTGSPFSAEFTMTAAETGYHRIFPLATIPGVNTTVSTLYVCRLTRIAASSNEYGSDVFVLFDDSHFESDDLGSAAEYTK